MPKPKKDKDKIEVEPGFEKRLSHLLKRVLRTPPKRHGPGARSPRKAKRPT